MGCVNRDVDERLKRIAEDVASLREHAVRHGVEDCLEAGIDRRGILWHGLLSGVLEIGRRYEQRQVFAPEVYNAVLALEAGVSGFGRPPFSSHPRGMLVLGIPAREVADIGRRLLSAVCGAEGFRVISLEPRRSLESVFRAQTWSVDIVALCPSLCKWGGNVQVLKRLVEAATGADHVLIAMGTEGPDYPWTPILDAMELLASLRDLLDTVYPGPKPAAG